MKDFNLSGYLRNNRLLKESVGGYRDIKPLREDDEFDQWCQENPEDCKRYKQSQEDADKAFTDEFGSYSSDETNEAESMTADPGWEYNDDDFDDKQFKSDFDQLLIDIEEGYGWIDPDYVQETWENSSEIPFDSVAHKVYRKLIDAGILFYSNENDPEKPGKRVRSLDQLEEGYGDAPPEGPNSFLPTDQDLPNSNSNANENKYVHQNPGDSNYIHQNPDWGDDDSEYAGDDDSEYANHMENYSDLEFEVMEIVSTLMNNGVDNKEIASWLRDIANDIAGEMMEGDADLEEKKPVSDDQRKAIWASYNNEAKETDAKEKPKAKGKLKEGKIRPSSSEFTWDI